MERKRYKTKAEIMAERIRRGTCDCCGGPTVQFPMHNRIATLCAGDCGWHEVGKRDGAIFNERAYGSRPKRQEK